MDRRGPGEVDKPQCQANVSCTHCEIWWGIGDDLGVLQQGCNRADSFLRRTVNQATYKVFLEESLLAAALIFLLLDNAPCHTAKSIKVWMKDHQIKTQSWPARSPDLNPIKNLWNVIKRNMDGHKPSNKAWLLEFLQQEWHKVTQQSCKRLVESMP